MKARNLMIAASLLCFITLGATDLFGQVATRTTNQPTRNTLTAGGGSPTVTTGGSGTMGQNNQSVVNADFTVTVLKNMIFITNLSSGDITGMTWDLGDGTHVSVPNPSWKYEISGTYKVCLTVFGPGGVSDKMCQLVTIPYF